MNDLKRTWVEIDLDALAHNYHALRARIGDGVKFLGVVKDSLESKIVVIGPPGS